MIKTQELVWEQLNGQRSVREHELELEVSRLKYENARLRWLVPPDAALVITDSPPTIRIDDLSCDVFRIAKCELRPRRDLRAHEVYSYGKTKEGMVHHSYLVDDVSLLHPRDVLYVIGDLHERLMMSLAKIIDDHEIDQ